MFPLFQVPSAAGPSTKVDTENQPKAQSPEDVIRLLRAQLEEKTQRVKNLEAELKDSQTQVQTSNDREEFLLAELAAHAHDRNYKLLFYLQISIFFSCTCFAKSYFPQVSKETQPRKIVLSKMNSSNYQHAALLRSGPIWRNLEYY